MTITAATGVTTTPVTMMIDRSRLRLFAKATGQTDPVYTDVDAARSAGHPDLLVPPTFLFGVELERDDAFGYLTAHGVCMADVLHGTQSFDYLSPVYAGQEVTARSQISDVTVRKGGALTFVQRDTAISRRDHAVARLTTVIVIRSAP